MSNYLLIESRDPFESNEVAYFYGLAGDLARAGHKVTLFLVQNGVLPARPCVQAEAVAAVARAGVEVLADDFALRERGIAADRLRSFIQRIERLEEEKAALTADIREVYAEAKGTGFDTKIMRQIVRLRKLDDAARQEQEALLEVYRKALGLD